MFILRAFGFTFLLRLLCLKNNGVGQFWKHHLRPKQRKAEYHERNLANWPGSHNTDGHKSRSSLSLGEHRVTCGWHMSVSCWRSGMRHNSQLFTSTSRSADFRQLYLHPLTVRNNAFKFFTSALSICILLSGEFR